MELLVLSSNFTSSLKPSLLSPHPFSTSLSLYHAMTLSIDSQLLSLVLFSFRVCVCVFSATMLCGLPCRIAHL